MERTTTVAMLGDMIKALHAQDRVEQLEEELRRERAMHVRMLAAQPVPPSDWRDRAIELAYCERLSDTDKNTVLIMLNLLDRLS